MHLFATEFDHHIYDIKVLFSLFKLTHRWYMYERYNMYEFCIKISQNHLQIVKYFFQLCTYIILNVSKNL